MYVKRYFVYMIQPSHAIISRMKEKGDMNKERII
jgi:hypothetical protein